MKIIIIPNEPNPNMSGRHYGIAKALTARGHEVHTLMWDLPHQMKPVQLVRHLFTSLITKEYMYEDLHMHKIGRLPLFWPHINGWLFRRQLRTIYRSIGADIVFAQSFTNETAMPIDIPFIYDLADDYAAPAIVYGSAIYKFVFRVLGVQKTMDYHCRNALAVTAVSDILCDYAAPFNCNVHKLPNGVESNIIQSVLSAKATGHVNPHSMIYVSGFGPWSRPIELMLAVVGLRKNFVDLTLTLVGEGSEVPAMQQFIADNKAESYIHYQGFVHDRKTVFELIKQHAIGLNISDKNIWRDAAHPMKVIEYSALGKTVVSTDLAGVTALKLPNVIMFSNGSKTKSLKKALRAALANSLSPIISKKISQQTLHDYDWSRISGDLMAIFETAITAHNQTSIVHVTPAYPPKLGGLEKVVQVLATTQQAMGQSVFVITSDQDAKNWMPSESFNVNRLRSFVFANTTIMPRLIMQLIKIPKRSVIHLHIAQAYTPEVTWLAAKIKRFSYIVHIHLDVPPSSFAGFLLGTYKRLVLKRVLKSAARVIVFTYDQKIATQEKYGLQPTKVLVIPNGVEAKFFYDTPRKVHRIPRLLFVGRLGYQKNLPQLLNALHGISDKFVTTLVGEGESKTELLQLAKQLNLKNMHFVGRAEGKDLKKHYKNADIFVLPSEREGMPLVLLEAMAMGLPTVATNVTGNRDVIRDGVNGLLVAYNDTNDLRRALTKLATEPDEYLKLSLGARQLSKQYSWDKIAAQFQVVYGDIS